MPCLLRRRCNVMFPLCRELFRRRFRCRSAHPTIKAGIARAIHRNGLAVNPSSSQRLRSTPNILAPTNNLADALNPGIRRDLSAFASHHITKRFGGKSIKCE